MADLKQCDRCKDVVSPSSMSGWSKLRIDKLDAVNAYDFDTNMELCSVCTHQVKKLLKEVPAKAAVR